MKKVTVILSLVMITIGGYACKSSKNSATSQQTSQQQGRQNGPPPTVAELFKQMDANKDGKLAKSEVKGPLLKDFAKIDTDKDGFITKVELEKAPKPDRQGPPNGGQGGPSRQ